jgi:hypothetical protein
MPDDSAAEQDFLSKSPHPVSRKPPWPIVFIALFQFFKAGYLLYLSTVFWKTYSLWAAAGRPGNSSFLQIFLNSPFLVLLPAFSIAFIVIGWGLLRLQDWARKILILAIVCTWIGSRHGSHPSLDAFLFQNSIDLSHVRFGTTFCVLLLDLLVFCCLVFYPDIAKTFGEPTNDMDIIP